jgi:DNA-binding transcriptional regulator of glucitol operon
VSQKIVYGVRTIFFLPFLIKAIYSFSAPQAIMSRGEVFFFSYSEKFKILSLANVLNANTNWIIAANLMKSLLVFIDCQAAELPSG